MSEITLSIIQRTKEFLQLEEDVSGVDLFRLLKEYRKEVHPDKVQGDKAKELAEERFKQAQTLLEELTQYLEQERLMRKPTELAFFSAAYDNVSVQAELDATKAERDKLVEENKRLVDSFNTLSDTEAEKRVAELKEETDAIKQLYKPSQASLTSLSVVFLLTAASAVMTKIEDVSKFLKRYSPVDEKFINTTLFFIFIMILLITLKRLIEYHLMKNKISEVGSTQFSAKFMEYVTSQKPVEKDNYKTFTEANVISFIELHVCKRQKLLEMFGFRIFSTETVEALKNYFINALLSKRLVEVWTANALDRTFLIKSGGWGRPRYYY